MPEWLKDLIIAIGGGTTVTIILLTALKSIVEKIVEKAIDTSFEKSTIKLSNRLERTTKAYEILLKKEFDYYARVDEIDKFANVIYPADPSHEIHDRIMRLISFVYTIASREPQEIVPLVFCEDEIRIKIILAVATGSLLDNPIRDAERAIKDKSINTIYILATGSKIDDAKTIARRVYENNSQDLYEPIETHYKRFTRRISGTESVCYELNLR